MCRIAGIYNPLSSNLETDILTMRDAMHRGGPDGKGVFIDKEHPLAFGHRRLALLDLSEAGHQPMTSTAGSLQIIFNGEIYNFLEIKALLEKEGFVFYTHSDTEVILNAYLFWGEACFEQFNGMFALAIWDKSKQEIVLARDHAGIKPLYYYITHQKLIFASEIRAFKALDPDWEEDKEWRIPFFAYGHLPEPFTTLQDVKPFPKGCYSVIQIPSLSITVTPFYAYTYQNTISNKAQAVRLLEEKIEQAVERHLVSDAPIGVFLSGGIDSSILTIIASKQINKRLKTLSIVFEEQDFSEEIYQKMIVDQTNVDHYSFVVTNDMFHQEFKEIMEAMDQPSIDGINSYFICKFARAYGLTAVLSGLGADELLGGYDSSRRSQLLKRLALMPSFVLSAISNLPHEKIKRVAYLKDNSLQNKYLFYRGIYNPVQIAHLLDISESEVNRVLSKVTVPVANTTNEAQLAAHVEQHLYMQNQLLKDTDFMSMWHGIEVRVPFLDKEVINLCNSIEPHLKFNFSEKPKYLLIEAFKNVLPNAIWNRKKQGFTFPFAKWINHIAPLSRGRAFEQKYYQLNHSIIHWSKYWTYILASYAKDEFVFLHKGFERACFYSTSTFTTLGGIEKFNRAMLAGLSGLEKEALLLADSASMYDTFCEARYFNQSNYRGYNKGKSLFVLKELINSYKYQKVILGHINLALFGLLIKRIHPRTKVYMVAHGIEVWGELTGLKKRILNKCDVILAVSNFTKAQLIKTNGIEADKIQVFYNTIDPFFHYPTQFQKPLQLVKRYNIAENDTIILTLTRLAYSEKYKGYDKVIEVMPEIIAAYPNVKYLIAGKPDEKEHERLKQLIAAKSLEKNVFLIGFIAEEEITDHYQLADLFIMPSRKEGFGIVFIEAMACGLPVIAGNQDGSVDALKNGELGLLINPENRNEIIDTLSQVLDSNSYTIPKKQQLQREVIGYFGFPQFYRSLKKQLIN